VTAGREAPRGASPLEIAVCSIPFQNPVLLASGTAAYGSEIAGVTDIEALGGIVTKAVSLEPREGAAAPRATFFPGGMLNAVGLANPGVEEVQRTHLPWLARNLRRARVFVNVVGFRSPDFAEVVARLDSSPGFQAFELNLSCPNVESGGLEFGSDPAAITNVVSRARAATRKPMFVKLSPTVVNIADAAMAARDAGADGITLVNTLPGLLIDVDRRAPILGFGSGGVSGSALLPVGVLATWKVASAIDIPIVGVGGISSGRDALQYMIAGASLVAVGTASLRDPRAAEKIVAGLRDWCDDNGVANIGSLVKSLDWKNK
jgi:dihydroorotate dehydrogenase (NAD+) catalytic subunit